MKLADKYLYYPFIRIPETTLVHSLLYKDRVKRIIPPQREMDAQQFEQAKLPNQICRQYLGYEFIESADYWGAKEAIADQFCFFLDEAHKTKNPQHFESLLGKGYKERLIFKKETYITGTQYFVYAAKFSRKVFDKLDSLYWMKYDKDRMSCELHNEICNIYMSLLAACISKMTNEPISTGHRQADDIMRSPLFLEFFSEFVPPHLQKNIDSAELCINLLMGGSDPERIIKPLHEVITFSEAVRIRCGLENERRDFCALVDDITDKAKAVDPSNPEAFLELEVKDILERANDYLSRIKSEALRNVSEERKSVIGNLQTGLSASFPALGLAADVFSGASPAPGIWSIGGTVLGLGALFIPRLANSDKKDEQLITTRQKAYLFMNRLWEITENTADHRVEQNA